MSYSNPVAAGNEGLTDEELNALVFAIDGTGPQDFGMQMKHLERMRKFARAVEAAAARKHSASDAASTVVDLPGLHVASEGELEAAATLVDALLDAETKGDGLLFVMRYRIDTIKADRARCSAATRAAVPRAAAQDVGDTLFEGWLSEHEQDANPQATRKYTKQDMRDGYWAGYSERAAAADEASDEVASKGEGLSPVQEPKYTVTGSAIVNRASGEAIPADEPIFIFRARDRLAADVLCEYVKNCEGVAQRQAVRARFIAFSDWADAHPEEMKKPDTVWPPAMT